MIQYAIFAALVCLAAVGVAAAQTTFSIPLDGARQVPPVETPATGHCLGVLDSDETTVSVSCIHDVTGTIAAHIHNAAAGENGDVVYPFDSPQSPIRQSFQVSAEQAAMLFAGELYLNVHSQGHPEGEIRGQISGPAEDVYNFVLAGAQQVPMVDSQAAGVCAAVLEPSQTHLAVACDHGVQDATGAHIHAAPAGQSGEVLISFGAADSPIVEVLQLSPADVSRLSARELYLNVHSGAHPDGEIRGQINRVPDGTYAGTYYDPQRDGEGILLEVSGDPPFIVVSWYSYAADGSGNQIFLIGSAAVVNNQAVVPMQITNGARFGELFDPGEVARTHWGTVTITFISCTRVILEYSGELPDYGDGILNLVRLTPPLTAVGTCD